jgi:hypothetical protein
LSPFIAFKRALCHKANGFYPEKSLSAVLPLP